MSRSVDLGGAHLLRGFFALRSPLWAVPISALLVTGCSEKKLDQVEASSGQVIGHVGSQSITKQELQDELRLDRSASVNEDRAAAVKHALEQIVVRKYLSQEALATHLDQQPAVMRAMEKSREQTLADDYLRETMPASLAKITAGDVSDYIKNHPLRFSQRTLLTVDQINVALTGNYQLTIESTKSLPSLTDIDQKLTEMGVPHTRSVGVLNSGDLPEDMFRAIQSREEGIFFAVMGTNGIYFRVKSKQSAPVVGSAAVALAEQLVKTEVLKKQIERAKEAAIGESRFEGAYTTVLKPNKGSAGNEYSVNGQEAGRD